ncbi:MAG: bifunctional phosphoglucose/phosphomannose isomerase [bacterium]
MTERPHDVLDDPGALSARDPEGMLDAVEGAGIQWEEAASAALGFRGPAAWRDLRAVVVAGMGGSAIAGDMAASYLSRRWPVRLQVVRDYRLPAWADRGTLLVASSYSGGTEETLSLWEEAGRRGMPRAALTTGGVLGAEAEAAGVPLLALPPGLQPRAALPSSLVGLLALLGRVGPAGPRSPGGEETLAEVRETGRVLRALPEEWGRESPSDGNPAKEAALWIGRGLPVIYGPEYPLAPVVTRWRGQLGENAKHLAWGNVLPEMNHNEIVGWEAQEELYPRMRVLFLEDEDQSDRMALRTRITRELVERAGARVWSARGSGEGLLSRMISLAALADYTSVYLACGWGVDPTPVEKIDYLKSQLTEDPS